MRRSWGLSAPAISLAMERISVPQAGQTMASEVPWSSSIEPHPGHRASTGR